MNRTPEPDWNSLPELILSVDAARLFGVLPKSLGTYVRRNLLSPPIPDGPNRALYRKEDLQEYWRKRDRQSAQFYSLNNLPAPIRSEQVQAAVAALAGKGSDLVLSPDEVRQMLQQGVTEGITNALTPLVSEITALRQEVTALREAIATAREEGNVEPTEQASRPQIEAPATMPPTGWRLWLRRLSPRS